MADRPATLTRVNWTHVLRSVAIWLGWLLGAAIVIAVCFVTAWAIGEWARPTGKPFPWGIAAAVGTAAGTVLLALVTAFLALATRRDVQASLQIAKATQAEYQERHRPVLIEESRSTSKVTDGQASLQIRLRNVGVGPALRVQVQATYNLDGGVRALLGTEAVPWHVPAIQVGDVVMTDLKFVLHAAQLDHFPEHGWETTVTCEDRTGRLVKDAFVR